ncbi:MAG: glycosyltransferase family 32 protein, partial [Faecousia sp.]
MIPKIIHYVWLSNQPKPDLIQSCIASWRRHLPEYEIREWSDFDFSSMPDFVTEALNAKKWAFATDYLRLYILDMVGGIYLDSDIFVKRNFDLFLDNGLFSFIEFHEKGFAPYSHLIDGSGKPLTGGHIPGFGIQAAFMGAEKGHPFLKDCMKWYDTHPFTQRDGTGQTPLVAPDVFALCARDYGFVYRDEQQDLKAHIRVYPSCFVAGSPAEARKGNYAVHFCAGSWREY